MRSLLISTLIISSDYIDYKMNQLKAIIPPKINNQNIVFKSYPHQSSVENTASAITEFKPNKLLFIGYNWSINKILKIIRNIKNNIPTTQIILAGPYPKEIPEKLLKNNPEISFILNYLHSDLLKKILQDPKIKNYDDSAIVNSSTFQENNNISTQPDFSSRISKLPSPYKLKTKNCFKNKIVPLKIQTGCQQNCIFCSSFPKDHPNKQPLKLKDLKSLEQEIKYIFRQKPKKISICDSVFNANSNFAKEICKILSKNNKENVPIWIKLSVEKTDEELAKLLKKTNIITIIDLPTTTPQVLKAINRNFNREKFKKGYNALEQFNIKKSWTLILGLPQETPESFQDVLKTVFFKKPELIKIYPLLISPGTKLWKKKQHPNLKFNSHPPHNVIQTKNFTPPELQKAFKIALASIFIYLRVQGFINPEEIFKLAEEWFYKGSYWKKIKLDEHAPFYTAGGFKLEDKFLETFPHMKKNLSKPIYFS